MVRNEASFKYQLKMLFTKSDLLKSGSLLLIQNVLNVLCFMINWPVYFVIRLRFVTAFLCFTSMYALVIHILRLASSGVKEKMGFLLRLCYYCVAFCILVSVGIFITVFVRIKIDIDELDSDNFKPYLLDKWMIMENLMITLGNYGWAI